MYHNISGFLSRFRHTRIFFAEQPGVMQRVVKSKILNIIRRQIRPVSTLTADIGVRFNALERRFPIEKPVWNNLLSSAPAHVEELLRNRGANTLIWLKTDKNCKRLKIQVLRSLDQNEHTAPCDFTLTQLEPLPVAELDRYAPIIALFVLAHAQPPVHRKNSHLVWARLVKTLTTTLDQELSSPSSKMPDSFKTSLRKLQAWAWFRAGEAFDDTARLGRAIRAYKSLISEQPKKSGIFETGQMRSNLAMLTLKYAHLSSGAEAYEQALDNIRDAQAKFQRLQFPILWARLQELKADAEYNLGERHGDLEYYEAATHTLLTVKRIWRQHNRLPQLAHVMQKLGNVYKKLGAGAPGCERLNQAVAAYKASMQAFASIQASEQEGGVSLSLACTLTELGEKTGSAENLKQAIILARKAEGLASSDQSHLPSTWIARGRALTVIGGRRDQKNHANLPLQKAAWYFEKALGKAKRLDRKLLLTAHSCRAQALDALGRQKNCERTLKNAADEFGNAINLLENPCEKNSGSAPASTSASTLARLYGQLAANLIFRGSRSSSLSLMEAAARAFTKALNLTDKHAQAHDWALLQGRLAACYMQQARHMDHTEEDTMDLAIQACHRALSALQKDRAPLLWAQIRNDLAKAFTLSAALGGGTPCLELALESYEKVLEQWSTDANPLERAAALNNMASVLADIGRREASSKKLEEARDAFLEAFDLYASRGHDSFARSIRSDIAALDELIRNDGRISAISIFNNLDKSGNFTQTLQ